MKAKKVRNSRNIGLPYLKNSTNENKDPNTKKKRNQSQKKKSNRLFMVSCQEAEARKKHLFKPDQNQMKNKILSLTPDVVIFYNITPDSFFEKKLIVKNVTSKKRKIAIKKPTLRNFKLEYNPVSFLAPGMSLTINVKAFAV